MPSSGQSAAQRRALRWAQASICAGCGERVPSSSRLGPQHPDYPTFDHVQLRCAGGGRTLRNGLLKHLRCNQRRGSSPASGCDLVWHAVVLARLAKRPRSLKSMFKGGVRNAVSLALPHARETAKASAIPPGT